MDTCTAATHQTVTVLIITNLSPSIISKLSIFINTSIKADNSHLSASYLQTRPLFQLLASSSLQTARGGVGHNWRGHWRGVEPGENSPRGHVIVEWLLDGPNHGARAKVVAFVSMITRSMTARLHRKQLNIIARSNASPKKLSMQKIREA